MQAYLASDKVLYPPLCLLENLIPRDAGNSVHPDFFRTGLRWTKESFASERRTKMTVRKIAFLTLAAIAIVHGGEAIYCVGGGLLFKSTDNGEHWSQSS